MSVRKFLDCSTAHLTDVTRHVLDEATLDESTIPAMRGMFGWLVWVPDDDAAFDCEPATPQDLRAVLMHARKLGCEYVLFDSDGPLVAGLPTYEESP